MTIGIGSSAADVSLLIAPSTTFFGEAESSAADVSLLISPPEPAQTTAVGAGSSAADVSLLIPAPAFGVGFSAPAFSEFIPTQAFSQTVAAPASAPPGVLFAAPALQLPASFVVAAEAGSSGGGTSIFSLGNGTGSSAMLPVASVFSSDPGPGLGGTGTGQVASSSDLPFMDDSGAGDTPIYTASDETPWIFVSDFGGDWFFV